MNTGEDLASGMLLDPGINARVPQRTRSRGNHDNILAPGYMECRGFEGFSKHSLCNLWLGNEPSDKYTKSPEKSKPKVSQVRSVVTFCGGNYIGGWGGFPFIKNCGKRCGRSN